MCDAHNKIKIISYNIWFEDFNKTERLYSLLERIDQEKPDVLCLQEVTEYDYEIIKKELSYEFRYPEKIDTRYGCVILSKYPMEKSITISLPSKMKRDLILSKININDFICVIANVHFESEFNNSNNIKKLQFKYVGAILNKLYCKYFNVVLCSDTNVTQYDEKQFSNCFYNFNDAWKINGSDSKTQFTYDYDTNSNLQLRNIKLKCRIDRILYKTNNFVCKSFGLLTGENLFIDPSDHHGISAVFIY